MNAVEMRGIVKQYPLVRAIDGADFTVEQGEIHSLLGENGAGKSTLMKILYGMTTPTAGEVRVFGKPVAITRPAQAIALGIGMVHQHFMLTPVMTVAENVVIGSEPVRGVFFDRKKAEAQVAAMIDEYNFHISATAKVETLSVGEQQRVEILKALYRGADLLILDEPTAVLTPQEVEDLFRVMRQLKAAGKSIIIITHKLGEVMDISDRVTILRKGKSVETVNTAESSEKQLTELMVGKAVELSIERPEPVNVKPILNVVDLTVKNSEGSIALDDVSFVINRGEILGVAGIAGSGQKELCETIAGLQKIEKGAVLYNKENIIGKTPKEIINLGISMSFIPEDRLGMGLIASVGMTDNMLLKTYKQGKLCFVDRKPAKALSKELIEKLEIKTPSTELPVRMLSGGNVQKVLLGREIHSEPDLLITAYPVRGLDINSSYLIYSLLNEQKKKNTAVLFIGEDLDVLLELCDRIMVLCHGKITGICDAKKVTKEQVGMMMTGSTMEEVLGIG